MRLILALFALLSVTAAFAWEADDQKALTDLLYIPNAGRLYGETAVQTMSAHADFKVSTVKGEIHQQSNTFTQELHYGLTDRLRASVIYENQFYQHQETEVTGGSKSSARTTGPSNPTVSALFRILRQADDKITLDVYGSYAPDMIDGKSDSSKGTSSYAAGGAVTTAGVRAGKKWKEVSMSLDASFAFHGDAESKDKTTGDKTKDQSTVTYDIKYFVQIPLVERLFARINIESQINSASKSKDKDGTSKYDMTSTSGIGGSLVFAVIPERMFVESGIAFASTADYRGKDSSGNTIKIDNQGGSMAFLKAGYQF